MYVLAALSPAVWTFGYVLELVTPTLQGKVFWDNVQFIGRGGWFMGFIAFTLQYVDRRPPRQYLTYGLVAHPSIGLVLLAFTDGVHGWLRPEALLVPGQPSFGEQQ